MISIDEYLSIENFKQWLNCFDDSQIVGISASNCECPVAKYLTELLPDEYISAKK